jgi:hypothetical protein
MKKLLLTMLLVPVMALAQNAETEGAVRSENTVNVPVPAGSTVVMRQQLGSGTPGFINLEPATALGDGIYHAPQYLPSNPTAATLWPRVIDVECAKTKMNSYVCDGYNWSPAMGRGEYLYIRPHTKEADAVVIVEKPVPFPVYVEKKKKKE